jgi:hypothetical protein
LPHNASSSFGGISNFSKIFMNHFLKSAMAIAAISLSATSSFAQNSTATKGYVGAEFGSVQFKDQTPLASALVSANGGTATSTQDTGVTVGRFFGGLTITENFDAEVAYINTATANATFSGVTRTAVAYSGSATIKITGFDFSALIRPSQSSGLNGLFVRVGGHSLSWQTDVRVATGTSSGAASTTSGTGALLGFGYDGKFTDKFGYRVAYTAYNSAAGVSGNDVSMFSVGLIARF